MNKYVKTFQSLCMLPDNVRNGETFQWLWHNIHSPNRMLTLNMDDIEFFAISVESATLKNDRFKIVLH